MKPDRKAVDRLRGAAMKEPCPMDIIFLTP
jgi:hypothetical protein